jgi:hypothetical protein
LIATRRIRVEPGAIARSTVAIVGGSVLVAIAITSIYFVQ